MNTLAFLPLSGDKEKSFETLTAGATKLFSSSMMKRPKS
jgi:hypothetical protein